MSQQQKKAEALMRALEEKLRLRGAPNVVKLSSTAIRISKSATPAVAEANMLIRIKPKADDIDRRDALNLPQRVYNPHICEILLEDALAGAEAAALQKKLSESIYELSRAGMAIDVLEHTDALAAVAAEADFEDSAKL